jgi:hypothetical protein
VIALVTDNPEKLRECARILGRHAVSVVQWPKAGFSEEGLPARFAADPKLDAVLRETSKLVFAADRSPVRPFLDPRAALAEVINVGRVVAWVRDRDQPGAIRRVEIEREIPGWLDPASAPRDPAVFDWDGVFRVRGLGRSYHEMRLLGLKNSARDLVLSDFAIGHLYLPERADLAHHPRRPSRTVDFDERPLDFIAQNRFLGALRADRPGLGRLVAHVVREGLFFRAAQNRREKNYWLPGLNAGVPLTPKRDAVHEITFLFHDLMHFAQPDLVFTGALGGDARAARNVYVAWRMVSEALSLVLADMLFVDGLARAGVDYDFSQRRIHPLFRCLDADPEGRFVETLRAVGEASARYALLGDDAAFRALRRPGVAAAELEAAVGAFEAKYEGYFKADYRWTVANFDEMVERAGIFSRWAALVGEDRLARADLRTLDATVRRLRAEHPAALGSLEGTVSTVTALALESLAAKASVAPPPFTADEARDRAFRRWVYGQCMMFVAWDFLPGSTALGRAVLATLDATPLVDGELIARIRARMDAHVEGLHAAGLVSGDDRNTYHGVFPLFEPRYVAYDRRGDDEPLASVARACFASEPNAVCFAGPGAEAGSARAVVEGVPCVDLALLFQAVRGVPPAKRLRALLAEAGVAFHDAERDLVRAPAAALVAVGGLPLRRHDEGWSLGGTAPDPDLPARVREAQRQAMGHAAAMTYLNPRDASPEDLCAAVLGRGHASIAHVASVTVLLAGLSTAVENELNGQRDLVHLARLTEARTAAQADPPACVLDARDVPLFRAALDQARAALAALPADDRAAPDRHEAHHLLFPAAKATLVLITGSLRSLEKLTAAIDDPGREIEYRRCLAALNDVLGALHPGLFRATEAYPWRV